MKTKIIVDELWSGSSVVVSDNEKKALAMLRKDSSTVKISNPDYKVMHNDSGNLLIKMSKVKSKVPRKLKKKLQEIS